MKKSAVNGAVTSVANSPVRKEPENTQSNELVYFLASLCIFIITALLASDSSAFFH